MDYKAVPVDLSIGYPLAESLIRTGSCFFI